MALTDRRDRLARRLVADNTARVRRADGGQPNPRPIEDEPWAAAVRAAHPRIAAEWQAFAAGGGQLPLIDDILGGNQGNVGGDWWSGPLIARRRPRRPLADVFPETVAVLRAIPHLISATWSVLAPGAELPPHTGINAGALNFLVGVVCPPGSGHEISGTAIDLTGGRIVVFDDTEPHAAWNRSDERRVLVIGDLLRPVPGVAGRINAVVQAVDYRLSPAYARAVQRAGERFQALNPPRP